MQVLIRLVRVLVEDEQAQLPVVEPIDKLLAVRDIPAVRECGRASLGDCHLAASEQRGVRTPLLVAHDRHMGLLDSV